MVALTVYLMVFAIMALAVYIKFYRRQRRKGEPFIVPGHFIFGNAKAFAKNAVAFIHEQHAKFGDIFTIHLLNQPLTIINDPHTYERFCKEKSFDFDPIQKQVNKNVFSFALINAKAMLKEASKTVRGEHLVSSMVSFSNHLNDALEINGGAPEDGYWNEDGLRALASKTMFQPIFKTIFGKGKSGDVFEPVTVYKNFDMFHKYFNQLWLGLPIKLFPTACRALEELIQQPSSDEILSRSDVSEYIRFSTQFMKAHGQTETDIIGHNLVFLHVNYNTFRMSYWLLYFLTQHPEALAALLEEINEEVEARAEEAAPNEDIQMSLEDLDRLDVLDSIVKETIRATSGVFMVRYIVEDTAFKMESGAVYNLRAGERVAMYPPALHKDPEIFESPMEFKYDRFTNNARFYKSAKEVKNPVLGFGSLCPGRKLAMSEAKWYLFNMVYRFDFKVADGQTCKPDAKYHGHEILPPTNDVKFLYRQKPNIRRVVLG